VLSNDFYVNDLVSGTSTIEEAIKMQQENSLAASNSRAYIEEVGI
jgi:hypothetical protein